MAIGALSQTHRGTTAPGEASATMTNIVPTWEAQLDTVGATRGMGNIYANIASSDFEDVPTSSRAEKVWPQLMNGALKSGGAQFLEQTKELQHELINESESLNQDGIQTHEAIVPAEQQQQLIVSNTPNLPDDKTEEFAQHIVQKILLRVTQLHTEEQQQDKRNSPLTPEHNQRPRRSRRWWVWGITTLADSSYI